MTITVSFFAGYTFFLGPQTIVFAEAKAIVMGICLAKSLNISLLWIETDSQLSVNILNNFINIPLSILPLLKNIKRVARDLGSFKFSHIYGEGNILISQIIWPTGEFVR